MSCLNIPNMIQIGSTGRNSGKTTVAKDIISTLKDEYKIYGLKIITIKDKGKCQRGESGCGICTSIEKGYDLIEEVDLNGQKDTMEILRAGCEKVFLLKAFTPHLKDGFLEFLNQIPMEKSVIICESNSIREIVKPGMFVMMNNTDLKSVKKSASKVIDKADLVLNSSTYIKENLKESKEWV
ncbi:MAG: hypothetical protein ACK5LT_10615 [Lachnospirales bacterium]